MANYKTYTQDPILGRIETVTAINADNLNTQNPVLLPSYPVDNIDYTSMIGTTPTAPTTEADPSWMKYLAPTETSNPYDSGVSNNQSSVDVNTQKVNDITAQLQAITNRTNASNLQLEGGASSGRAANTTAQILTGEQQNANRQAAIEALPLQAQLQAAQGNLTAAQSKLDKAFQLQQNYSTQAYNYNKDLRDKVYQYATAEEQRKLDAQSKLEDRAYSEKQATLKNAQSIAQEAMANGQADIASQITALDPKSKTYTQDVAKLQAKIVNPTAELDKQLKQLQIAKAKQDLIPNTIPTTPEEINTQKENQILGLQDKINTLDTLIKGDLPAVGTNIFSRGDPFTVFTGNTQNFIASVQQLVSKDTLDTLINLKKAGGTLGALSDQERIMLQSAATKIGTWAIKDKVGNVLGYNINQKAFKDELKTIKTLTERALKASGGVPVASYLDTVDSVLSGSNNPYSTYIK